MTAEVKWVGCQSRLANPEAANSAESFAALYEQFFIHQVKQVETISHEKIKNTETVLEQIS